MGQATVQKQLTVDVTCVDCGAIRTVAVQDAKQVKRCVECQEKYRKAQRKEYRKNLVKDLRTTVAEQAEQIANLKGQIAELEQAINQQ